MLNFISRIWRSLTRTSADEEPPEADAPSEAAHAGVNKVERRDGFPQLSIDEESPDGRVVFHLGDEFFVMGRFSPSRRFLVGAVDGRHKDQGASPGQVTLLDLVEKRVAFRAPVLRPHNPWVSNAGMVSVEDWKGWGGELAGEVIVFHPSGERAWARQFKANVGDTGMSANGELMFYSTCSSDFESHSGKTWLVHLSTGEPLWERQGFGNLRFQGDDLLIGIQGAHPHPDNEFFALNADGTAPDAFERAREAYRERVNRTRPWWVLSKVEGALKGGVSAEELSDLLPLIDEMVDANDLEDGKLARVWRFRGEIAERQGRERDAYECWTEALRLDSKVGVKRKHAALAKRLEEAGG
ncbi:MAG: tetratricopeptide repeat protein [Alphaproteobacteria bacterium]|nr:tetratricopeptide repeat protein [Alphaproteobacteria bacterium]